MMPNLYMKTLLLYTKTYSPSSINHNPIEERHAIDESTRILFEKGNGLELIIPIMADKYPTCPSLQINTAIMYFHSFSTKKIKDEFPKYLCRINPKELSITTHMHYTALLKLQEIDFEGAYSEYCMLLQRNPYDLLAILMVETVGFMCGKTSEMVTVYESVYKFHKSCPTFLAMIAFLYSHVNRHEEAKFHLKVALEKDPHNAWVQHVYAHLLLPNELEDGIGFLEQCTSDWRKQNRFFEGHNWMHLCLLYLHSNKCNANLILQAYKDHIWGEAKSLIFEQNNAFLILIHLNIAAKSKLVDLEDKKEQIHLMWVELADYAKHYMTDYFTPYLTVTSILTVAMVYPTKANLAVEKFKVFAENHLPTSKKYYAWYTIALPILQGSIAYIYNDYALSAKFLEPVYNKTGVMGHSDEQRSFFIEIYKLVKQNRIISKL